VNLAAAHPKPGPTRPAPRPVQTGSGRCHPTDGKQQTEATDGVDRRKQERRDGEGDQGGVRQCPLADRGDGLGDDGEQGGGEPGEQGGDRCGRAEPDVDRGKRQQRHDTGQHEQDPGHQATTGAVEQPADVDGELLGLRAGQQRAVAQRVQEPLLPDPALLLHQDALHHRDLPGRAAEGLQRDREPGPQRLAERH